jgi:hypothetical protein
MGLSRAGFEHQILVERDADAVATVNHNRLLGIEHVAHWPLTSKDVREVDWSPFRGKIALSTRHKNVPLFRNVRVSPPGWRRASAIGPVGEKLVPVVHRGNPRDAECLFQKLTQRRAGGSCGPTGASRVARAHCQTLRDETLSPRIGLRPGSASAGGHG